MTDKITEIPGQIPAPASVQGIPTMHPKAQKPLNKLLFKMLSPKTKLRSPSRIKHKKVKFY